MILEFLLDFQAIKRSLTFLTHSLTGQSATEEGHRGYRGQEESHKLKKVENPRSRNYMGRLIAKLRA